MQGERYQRQQLLGDGGMGEVWRGVDTVLRRDVALKTPLPRLAQDPMFAERFRREARAMAAVRHDNIIDIYDVCDSDDGPFIVMEYVPGGSVADLLQQRGRLRPDETMTIVAQAARALAAAHARGVVHRDVKPANLLLRDDGSIVLTDFGIARTSTTDMITSPGENVGTATYMAPELFDNSVPTARSDIYALGVVAYECLAGRPPFQADSVVAVATMHVMREPPPLPDDVPADVRHVVLRCLAKSPPARYASATDLIDAIERPATPPTRRRGTRRWLVAALALAVAGAATGLIVRAYGDSGPGGNHDAIGSNPPATMPADLSGFAAGWPLATCTKDAVPAPNQVERWSCRLDETKATWLFVIRYEPGRRDATRTSNDRMRPTAGGLELKRGTATSPGGATGRYREYEINIAADGKPADWKDQIWFDNSPVASPDLALIVRTNRTPDTATAIAHVRDLWQKAGYSEPRS
jgi:hypothetical protein